MTVLAIDEFSGAPVFNMAGRIADGGSWEQIEFGISGRHIGINNGEAFGQTGTGSNRGFYRLVRSSGIWPTDYKITVQFEVGFVDFEIGVRCTNDNSVAISRRLQGYTLGIFTDGYSVGEQLDCILNSRTDAGSDTLFDSFDLPDPPTYLNVNTATLEVQGSTIKVYFNGVLLTTVINTDHNGVGDFYPILRIFSQHGGADILGIDFPVPSNQTEFNSLWSPGGDSNVEWFITSHSGLGNLIYAHITGPQGVSGAISTRTRTLTGLEPNTDYLLVIPKLIRACGVGEPSNTYHFVVISVPVTSDGSGNLIVTLTYEFSRSGQAWTLVDDGHTTSFAVTGTDSVDDKGVGIVTLDWVDTTSLVNQHSLHNSHMTGQGDTSDPGISDVPNFGLEHRVWCSVRGRQDFMQSWFDSIFVFESGEYDNVEFPNVYIHSGGSYFQGFEGQLTHLIPDQDDHLEFEVHDLLIGADTLWKGINLTKVTIITEPGVDWFKVEDLEPCEIPPVPPFPPPPNADLVRVYPHKTQIWHPLPSPPPVRYRRAFRERVIVPGAVREYIMYRMGWREVLYYDGETLPDPEGPGWDPCGLLPPILPPGEVIPLVGRFFGISQTPTSVMGPLLTGTQFATGPWLNENLTAAVSKDLVITGAQGGGSGIKDPGNVWNQTTFINGTIDKISPLYSLLAAHTPQYFAGYSAADDLASRTLWKPNGLLIGDAFAEFISALATLRGMFPLIRMGVRLRPSQVGIDIGAQFYSCQFHAQLGDPFDFAANEYSIAASRSAFISLDLNYVHGGDGSSGIRFLNGTIKGQSSNNWECSAAEVQFYLTRMYEGVLSVDPSAAWLMGTKGYTFYPDFLTRVGMLAALANARNELAGLPPP